MECDLKVTFSKDARRAGKTGGKNSGRRAGSVFTGRRGGNKRQGGNPRVCRIRSGDVTNRVMDDTERFFSLLRFRDMIDPATGIRMGGG